jgi:hypothetical protein
VVPDVSKQHVTLILKQQIDRDDVTPQNSGVLAHTAVNTSELLHSLLLFVTVTTANEISSLAQ